MSTDEETTKLGEYTPSDEEQAVIDKWNKRFKIADNFRDPYERKMLRMWKLYRAYRDKTNYAYNTNLMPPIGFEIVETVKPRLSAAKMRTRIFPVNKDDVGNGAIEEWERVTGMSAGSVGCNCCGPPHTFEYTNDSGNTTYIAPADVYESELEWYE